ncbi:hypothetical protein B0A49_00862 [Cryomyces minteri]|uniref:N-end rule aminoacyl transferase C-terminal domain-containing protein n=1 Tax=Cryomyces minteri TaxID=331657 RepID=A0A4U0Y0A0_9PEZI|nr:hypothetical protein B0A49_00862 [Cryomyces minteri]
MCAGPVVHTTLSATQLKPAKDQRQALNRWNRFVLGETYVKEIARLYPKSKVDKARQRNDFDLLSTVHESEYNTLQKPPEPEHRFEVSLEPDDFTEEKFRLYEDYQKNVHHDPPSQISRGSFKRFLCSSPLRRTSCSVNGIKQDRGSFHQCYRLDGKLIAMAVLDLLPHCVSGVYFLYHRDFEKWSFGKLSAMREAALAVEKGYEYYYMGYYIHSCAKMRYKGDYNPQFILDLETLEWNELDDEIRALLAIQKYVSISRERRLATEQTEAIEAEKCKSDKQSGAIVDQQYLFDNPAEAADSDLSLFDLTMPGMMTVNEVMEHIDLDHMSLEIRGAVHRMEQLVSISADSKLSGKHESQDTPYREENTPSTALTTTLTKLPNMDLNMYCINGKEISGELIRSFRLRCPHLQATGSCNSCFTFSCGGYWFCQNEACQGHDSRRYKSYGDALLMVRQQMAFANRAEGREGDRQYVEASDCGRHRSSDGGEEPAVRTPSEDDHDGHEHDLEFGARERRPYFQNHYTRNLAPFCVDNESSQSDLLALGARERRPYFQGSNKQSQLPSRNDTDSIQKDQPGSGPRARRPYFHNSNMVQQRISLVPSLDDQETPNIKPMDDEVTLQADVERALRLSKQQGAVHDSERDAELAEAIRLSKIETERRHNFRSLNSMMGSEGAPASRPKRGASTAQASIPKVAEISTAPVMAVAERSSSAADNRPLELPPVRENRFTASINGERGVTGATVPQGPTRTFFGRQNSTAERAAEPFGSGDLQKTFSTSQRPHPSRSSMSDSSFATTDSISRNDRMAAEDSVTREAGQSTAASRVRNPMPSQRSQQPKPSRPLPGPGRPLTSIPSVRSAEPASGRARDTLVARNAPQVSNANRGKPPRYVLDIRDTNGDVRLDPETGMKLPRPVGELLRCQSEDQNPSSVT